MYSLSHDIFSVHWLLLLFFFYWSYEVSVANKYWKILHAIHITLKQHTFLINIKLTATAQLVLPSPLFSKQRGSRGIYKSLHIEILFFAYRRLLGS